MNRHDETADSADSDVIRSHYDWSSIRPSIAVMRTVAAVTGCRPTDLDSLHGSIDPDALNRVVESMTDARGAGSEQITFWYQEHQVTIEPEPGAVSVQAGEELPRQ